MTIAGPSPLELSAAVGRAESFLNRWNKKDLSYSLNPGPESVLEIVAFPNCMATEQRTKTEKK